MLRSNRWTAAAAALCLLCASCSSGQQAPASSSPSSGAASGGAPASSASSQAASEAPGNPSKTGLPIVQAPIRLNALCNKDINVTDWSEHPAIAEMEKRTGIQITWDCVPDAGFVEKRNLRFASNDLPDFVMRAKLSAQLEMKYASAGQLVALDGLMDYAPNFSELTKNDPNIVKNVALPDGHIYSLPQLNTTEGNLVQNYWINKAWLDKLGLPMPTTLDEFYTTLKAFKEKDPNGNGQADEIAYAGSAKAEARNLFYNFLGAWGIGKNSPMSGDGNGYSYLDVNDSGKMYLVALDPRYQEVVEYFRKLWSEGLIDKDSFSQDRNQIVSKLTADQVGFVSDGNNTQWIGPSKGNFVQPPALKGPNGDSYWINVSSFVQTTGTACITTANKYPEATMRWLDYFYSEEGTVLVRLGIEGESFFKDDKGAYQLFDNIKKDPTGLTLDQALGKWALFCGGNFPQNISDKVDQSAAQLPETKAATETLRKDLVPYQQIPRLKFTDAESVQLGNYAQDLLAYINENTVKFITGERGMDTWDAFTKELSKMNIEEYIKIYQDSYDRWMS